jgi:hypothetical protein
MPAGTSRNGRSGRTLWNACSALSRRRSSRPLPAWSSGWIWVANTVSPLTCIKARGSRSVETTTQNAHVACDARHKVKFTWNSGLTINPLEIGALCSITRLVEKLDAGSDVPAEVALLSSTCLTSLDDGECSLLVEVRLGTRPWTIPCSEGAEAPAILSDS